MKTVGGIGAASALGVGAIAATGGAAAASSSLDITNTSISNDDGDVTQVGVAIDHQAQWDGFDYPVEAVAYRDVIKMVNDDGSIGASHVLYDNRDAPVLLSNWSGNGDSNGWGGDDEHTNGPGTDSYVHAGIDWTVLAEDPDSAGTTESPGQIDNFGLDNDTDNSYKKTTLRYVKEVYFYTSDANGSYTSADGSTTLGLMGGDDGTMDKVRSEDEFTVKVTNEKATASSSGSGSSSAS
jgi:hypothetical protein